MRRCCALIVKKNYAIWAHAGDSRLYFFRGGRLIHRTEDHTYAEQLRLEGRHEDAELAAARYKNILVSALGINKKPKVQIGEDSTLREGDIFLLTSDGLWAYFEDDELIEILYQLPPREASERLVTLARERAEGRGDNLSLAIIKLEPQPKKPRLARHRLRAPLRRACASPRALLPSFPGPACARARRSSRFLRSAALASARFAASVCFCSYSATFFALAAARCCSFATRSACSFCLRSYSARLRAISSSVAGGFAASAALFVVLLLRLGGACPARLVQSLAAASPAPRACAADPPRRACDAGPWPRLRRAERRAAQPRVRAAPSRGSR